MRNSKLMFAMGITATVTLLAGCAGKIRYPSYYILNVPAPVSTSEVSQPLFGTVAVREFSAPRFLSSGRIAYRPSAERVDFYEYHRWAEDPRRVITAAIMREMQARGIFHSVDFFDGHGSPDCLMTGSIDHLEEVDQGSDVSIEVSLSARLINLKTGEAIWKGSSSKTAKLDKRSVAGIVGEMSRGVAIAVDGLVSSMQDRVSAVSLSLGHLNAER